MMHKLSAGDKAFLNRFESGEIQPAEFNHRGHLRLAYTYLASHDTETAYARMRESITNFLARNPVDPNKYHETITRAWILAIRHFMKESSSSESAECFIHNNPEMLDPKIMMTHYSAGLLFSDRAREEFAEPDLDPIPRYNSSDE